MIHNALSYDYLLTKVKDTLIVAWKYNRSNKINLLIFAHSWQSWNNSQKVGFFPFWSRGIKRCICILFWLLWPPSNPSVFYLSWVWKLCSKSCLIILWIHSTLDLRSTRKRILMSTESFYSFRALNKWLIMKMKFKGRI